MEQLIMLTVMVAVVVTATILRLPRKLGYCGDGSYYYDSAAEHTAGAGADGDVNVNVRWWK
jgi:hypothetical protein